jgi:diguanylate cyclase (GGDEF)-like protein
MRSKWAARDAGRPEASDFFPVVTGPNAQVSPLGMAITLPIFSDGLVPDNKDARRERLIGYLAGVYDLETLLLRPLSELGARGLNALLTDGGMSGNQVARTVGDGSGFGHEQSISVLGRDWRLRVELTSDQAFAANGSRFYILPGVVVLVGLVVLGFMTLLARKATALSRARERLATALSNEQASKAELLELSRHDPLTGLLNRRAFFEQLQSEIQRASRHDVPMTLMMMDLDRFKRINDGWGHPTGDEALRLFAKICVEQLRETDLVARIGGEEFGCVLIHTDLDTASMIAERLRRAVAGATVASDPAKGELKLSVSIGLAAHDRHMTPERLVRHADQALYQAKDSGRNRVEVYDDAQQPPSSGVSSCLPAT